MCNRCYFVNLSHVSNIAGQQVTVGGVELQISQPRKKQFLADFKAYTGG